MQPDLAFREVGCWLYSDFTFIPFFDSEHFLNFHFQAIIDPSHKIDFPRDQNSLRGHDPQVVDVLQRCLVRDVNHRASISELLNHSYLKSEPIKESNNKHLAVDLSSYAQLTPNTFKRVVMESLNNKNLPPPPAYSQDSWGGNGNGKEEKPTR